MRTFDASPIGSALPDAGPAVDEVSRPELAYRPALDGVRAVAVILVVVFHALPDALPGGFVGVDVFFVLSGYLITSLLVNEVGRTGRIRFSAFWARRARRLLPALLVVTGAICLLAWAVPSVTNVANLRDDVASTLGYVVNWRFVVAHQDYFSQFARPSLLQHAWSLAIEEQFYLVWPLIVGAALVWRRVRPSHFAIGCALAAAVSAIWMAVLSANGASSSRIYFGTDTRAQALLLGAALGAAGVGRHLLRTRRVRRLVEAVGVLGLGGLVAWCLFLDERSSQLYTGGLTLVALCALALVADAAQPDPSPLGRVLGTRPLVGLGRISYGVYLWHWPVILLVTGARIGVGGVALFTLRVAITLAVSIASYHLIEMPVRRGALRRWRPWVAIPTAVAAIAVGAVVLTANAEPAFTVPTASRELHAAPAVPATSPTGAGSPAAPAPPPPARVLVVGDSVALTVGMGIGGLARAENLVVSNDGILGCGILRGGKIFVDTGWFDIGANCQEWPSRWAADVTFTDAQVVVVLTGTWDMYDRRLDGREIAFGTPESDRMILDDLRGTADVLSSRGAQVVFLTAPYIEKENDPNPPAEYRSAFDRPRVDHYNGLVRQALAGDPRVDIVDLNGFLAPGGELRRTRDGAPLQADGVHFGPGGRDVVAEWLMPWISAAAFEASRRAS